MNIMVTEIYDALMSANADEDKARRAAEVLATSDAERKQQFAELREDNQKMRTEMAAFRGELKAEMEALRGELRGEISALDTKMTGIEGALRTEMTALRGELKLIKWMMGALIALIAAVFARTLFL